MIEKRTIVLAAVGLCFLMLIYPPWMAVVPNFGGQSVELNVGYEFAWNMQSIGYEINFGRLVAQWIVVAVLAFLGMKYFAKP